MKFTYKYILVLSILFLIASNSKIISQENRVIREYYKDLVISSESWFGTDDIIDSLKTFYKSGKPNENFYFKKGLYHGYCFQRNLLGQKLTTWQFSDGKLTNRIDHKINFNKKNKEKVINLHKRINEVNERTDYNPKTLSDFYNRAHARYWLGNTTLALNDFLHIEKQFIPSSMNANSKDTEYYYNTIYDILGSIYGEYENENFALNYKYKTVRNSPTDGRLLYNFGLYLFQIKAYNLAIYYLNEAITKGNNLFFPNWTLGMLYSDIGEYEKALKCINIAFEGEKTIYDYSSGKAERDIYTTRGLILHKLGETEKGISDLNEALSINKNNSYALKNLGVIYSDIKDYNKACIYLQKAKSLNYIKTHTNDIQFYIDKSCNNIKSNEIYPVYSPKKEPYIAPNPISTILNIKNYSNKDFQYKIYDYEYKLIKSGTSNDFSIDISTLKPDFYRLKIIEKEKSKMFIIIKE